jgi:hypothetical protein
VRTGLSVPITSSVTVDHPGGGSVTSPAMITGPVPAVRLPAGDTAGWVAAAVPAQGIVEGRGDPAAASLARGSPGILRRGALRARQPRSRAGACRGRGRQDRWRAPMPGPQQWRALARPALRQARSWRLPPQWCGPTGPGGLSAGPYLRGGQEPVGPLPGELAGLAEDDRDVSPGNSRGSATDRRVDTRKCS